MGALEGKVAVVTGAAMGIGRASALTFAREGASVVVADIDESGGRETVASIESAGGQASFIRTDVSVKADVVAMVQHAVDTYGGLDCAHNNAGIAAPMVPLADYPDDGWDRTIAVMLTGVYHCLKAEIPRMLERGGGAIVNTASVAAFDGQMGQVAYSASKGGVVAMTLPVARDLARSGIRVMTIAPGIVDTPILDNRPEPPPKEVRDAALKPEDVAQACFFLATLPPHAYVPELVMVPTALQALGKTSTATPPMRSGE